MAEQTLLPVTVIYGDGVGAEVMEATLSILRFANAPIHIESASIGQVHYERDISTGIAPDAWEPIKRNKVILKAPSALPTLEIHKNSDISLKKMLGLHVSVDCFEAFTGISGVSEPFSRFVVSESEEALSAGIEHQPDDETVQFTYVQTAKQIERLLTYAKMLATTLGEDYATIVHQCDLLTLTENFSYKQSKLWQRKHDGFELKYLSANDLPFLQETAGRKVLAASNLHRLMLRALYSNQIGTPWISYSYHLGEGHALFEPNHPALLEGVGEDEANPSGMLLAAVTMLDYLGHQEVARKIKQAWLSTIEAGIHTKDMYDASISKKCVGTKEFSDEISTRLHEASDNLPQVELSPIPVFEDSEYPILPSLQVLVGADVFISWQKEFDNLIKLINNLSQATENKALKLQMVGSRGLKLWPETEMANQLEPGDFIRARFVAQGIGEKIATQEDVAQLIAALTAHGFSFFRVDKLHVYNDRLGFTLAYGE